MSLKQLIEKMDTISGGNNGPQILHEDVAQDNNVAEDTQETPAGRIHKAKPGGYGRQFDTDIEGNEVGTPLKQIVKRGRGRPRKDADPTGYVPKYDFAKALQGWMVGNLPKGGLPGKTGVKHKLKDWMERVEAAKLNEGYIAEGRMADVYTMLQDLAANGSIREAERLMTNPKGPVEEYAGNVLMDYLDMVAAENSSASESDLGAMLMRKVDDEFGDTLEETQVQAPVPVVSGGKAQQATLTSTSTKPGESDVLKAAAAILKSGGGQIQMPQQTGQAQPQQGQQSQQGQQGQQTNQPIKTMAEDKNIIEKGKKIVAESAGVDRLKEILDDYRHEHKMCQEGWGMHESLYQALCDHYWREGRIPRDRMHGDRQELRDWIEECYMEDIQQLNENPLGAVVRGAMADRLLGDSLDPELDMESDLAEMEDTIAESKLELDEEQEMEESGLQAYLGKKKYGEEGMEALQKAGREGASKEEMAKIRAKYDKLDEQGLSEEVDTGEYDARKSTPSSKEEQDKVHAKHRERMQKLRKEMDDEDKKKDVAESVVNEKLTKSMTAGEIISDFVGSKDPKFKEKSKKERTKMALGAYYGMHPEKSKKKADEDKDPQMEAWSRELDTLLNEGLTLTTSTGQPGGSDSVSVSATDEDAKTLMKLIQDAGLMKAQSGSMSLPAGDKPSMTVEPVSQDEVMGTLEPADDDGDGAMSFLKRMLGARGEHAGHSHGDYEQEGGDETCEECGHSDCQCDHEEVGEMHNQAASAGDANMSALPEELHGGQKELDLNKSGDLDAEDFKMLRAKGKEEKEKTDEEALDQPATMEGERCDECGGVMESDHKCGGADEGPGATGEKYGIEAFMAKEEKLDEWANSRGGKSTDEAFLADLTFMTKTLSGGLNNIKQDQTTLPSTRVKSEERNVETSMAELLKKLGNIN